MNKYRIQVLRLSETRWNVFCEITTQLGDTFIYSGRDDKKGISRQGVGLLLTLGTKRGFLEWAPVYERIIRAYFRTRVRIISLIQCYVPQKQQLINKILFLQD